MKININYPVLFIAWNNYTPADSTIVTRRSFYPNTWLGFCGEIYRRHNLYGKATKLCTIKGK